MNSLDVLVSVSSTLVLVLAASFGCGEFLFAPLRETERGPRRRSRYRMADLATLLVQLQLGAGAVLAVMPRGELADRVIWIACTWIVLIFWWAQGVSLLEEAGVETTPERIWFLGVVAPLGFAALLLLIPLAPVFVTVTFIGLVVVATGDFSFGEIGAPLIVLAMLLFVVSALVAVVAGCRLACRNLAQVEVLSPSPSGRETG